MAKLSVAMVSPWAVKCGIYTYTKNLSEALAQLGVDIYIVRWPRFGGRTPEMVQSMVLDRIPLDRVDLIHTQHEYGLFNPNLEGGYFVALKRLGKPCITTMHATGNYIKDGVVADVSDRVIVHNEFMGRHFNGPSVVIPHGCVGPFNCPPLDECKRSLGIDPRAPLVGYVGFISPVKGLEMLVEAMRGVPEAALLIGGGWHAEPGTQYIIDLKQRSLALLPRRCQWLGYVPDERLATVYGTMQVVCYPSRYVSESGALLMALSHGKAVIASRLPPTKEKEKFGALMTFRSVKDLRRKIRRLLKDEELRRSLEEGAKKYAFQNRWEAVAELHLSLYEDVVEKRGKDK